MLKALRGFVGVLAVAVLMTGLVACGGTGLGAVPDPTDPTTGSWRAQLLGGSSGGYGSTAATDDLAYAVRVNDPETGKQAFALILLDESVANTPGFYLTYLAIDGEPEVAALYVDNLAKIYAAEDGVTGSVSANLSERGNRVTGSLTAALEDIEGVSTTGV